MRTAIVTLGRLGDQLITLPIVRHEFMLGNRPTLVVAAEYTELLGGVSYCDGEIFHGPYSDAPGAAKKMEDSGRFDRVLIAQAYGTRHDTLCASFAEEMWRLCGYGEQWGKLPLIFDRRDAAREAKLLSRAGITDKPMLLLSAEGRSSPFHGASELRTIISGLASEYNVVDLAQCRAERFYDLLGLYERAKALVSIDSGPLHLANAVPSLPVVALITDSPTTWHGAPPMPNHAIRIRYKEWDSRKSEIVPFLMNTQADTRKIIHVFSDYRSRKPDALKRHQIAYASWASEYQSSCRWHELPVQDEWLPRSASAVGDRPLPFVNDLIQRAADYCEPHDIICLTNDDTVFVQGITDVILKEPGPFWGGRYEHKNISGPLRPDTIRKNAYKHVGADIFVFTKQWWLENKDAYPDFIVAREAWDLCLRTLINRRGGCEKEGLVAHVIHAPEWHSPKFRECSGNLFNRGNARKFFSSQNMPWPAL